jgi:hypothetical protein
MAPSSFLGSHSSSSQRALPWKFMWTVPPKIANVSWWLCTNGAADLTIRSFDG